MKRTRMKMFLMLVVSLILTVSLLAACSDSITTSVPPTTTTTGAATTAAATATNASTNISTTSIPTVTPAPILGTKPTTAPTIATATPQTDTGTTVPPIGTLLPKDVNRELFIDDHSNPIQLIRSYYNSINRHEYVRAYSYWNGNNQPYPAFEKGFATTAEVKISTGIITGGPAAGTTYYSLPIVLNATDMVGKTQLFVGFYEIALSNPANYGAPPILPMHINKGFVQPLTMTHPEDQLAVLLQTSEITRDNAITITPDDGRAVDASVYLDSRSTPQELLRSYYNSINRKEYVRAYSYWQDNPTVYEQFARGFETTANVQLTMGQVTADAATGHRYYRVPVVIVSRLNGDKVQTFSDCYTLHKLDAAFFLMPPVKPLGIVSADIKAVSASTTNPADLLPQSCK